MASGVAARVAGSMTGKQAWAVMGVGILAYEVYAVRQDPEQLLSRIVDEWLVSHPVLTRAIIASVALHLLNLAPRAVDPLHLLLTMIEKGTGKHAA